MKYCKQCGISLQNEEMVCHACGEKSVNVMNQNNELNQEPIVAKKKKNLFMAGSIIIGISMIVLIGMLIPKFASKNGTNDAYFYYIKDNEVLYLDFNERDPLRLSEKIYKDTTKQNYIYYVTSFFNVSDDNKIMIYPNNTQAITDGVDLYYNNRNKNIYNKKIDSQIKQHFVSEDFTKLYYVKGPTRTLYLYNFDEKSTIGSNVSFFYINMDGSVVVYQDQENNIYTKTEGKEKELIAKNSKLRGVSEDLSYIYYLTADGALYTYTKGDKQLIDNSVSDVVKVTDSGEAYYYKEEKQLMTWSDFIEDDLIELDQVMVEPAPIEEPYYMDYDTMLDYYEALEEYYDAYEQMLTDEYETYAEKLVRDEIRALFDEPFEAYQRKDLYYTDGTEKMLIDSNYDKMLYLASSKSVFSYTIKPDTILNKIKMSELTGNMNLLTLLDDEASTKIAIKDVSYELASGPVEHVYMNNALDCVYFTKEGVLHLASISDGLGELSMYDQDVAAFIPIEGTDDIITLKVQDNYKFTLYVNKEKVDENVTRDFIELIPNTNKFVYYKNFDTTTYSGELTLYDGTKAVLLGDGVRDYYVINEDKIIMFNDYDKETGIGKIHLVEGTKVTKMLDEKVSEIIKIPAWQKNR